MRVLMPGWEFPPHISGGLGTACRGLAGGLAGLGVGVTFVLPRARGDEDGGGARVIGCWAGEPAPLRRRAVESVLRPYLDDAGYRSRARGSGGGLLGAVEAYAAAVAALARGEEYDLVHGHDWMAFPAAAAAARERSVPLVLHFHSCESDRSGPRAHPGIREVERRGALSADAVICVSRYTAERVRREYGVPTGRLRVVHNATALADRPPPARVSRRLPGPLVLFLGRVTWQKGPEVFLQAAARVAREEPSARFLVAGDGDLLPSIVERAAEMGLARRLHFAGFLRGDEVERAFAEADVFVMPSVSEPFGIVALEAMARGVPVVISRQSGAAEVLRNVLRNDSWDAEGLADSILSLLRRPALRARLASAGRREARRFRWARQAALVRRVYEEVLP